MMKLYTTDNDPSWKRTVFLYTSRDDDALSQINNEDTCKIIYFCSGTGIAESSGKSFVICSPELICLTPDKKFSLIENNNLKSKVLYFKPEVINDILTYDKLNSGALKDTIGTTIYQDFSLLKAFYVIDKPVEYIFRLTPFSAKKIDSLFDNIDSELTLQYDGFWPCRSRSFFIELLFFISYSLTKENVMSDAEMLCNESRLVQEIICYLNEHLSDKIVLSDLSKRFAVNRNKLNEEFHNATGLTCMEYLMKIRLQLSSIMLKDTELPISEIAARIGYVDTNYFIKVFKKSYKITPAQYRKKADTSATLSS